MGDREYREYVQHLAEHGIDGDQCRQLQALIDEGNAAEVKAHLSSWVKRCARDVIAKRRTAMKGDGDMVDIERLARQVCDDVAALQIQFDGGVKKVLHDMSDPTLRALVEHFEQEKIPPHDTVKRNVKHAAEVELAFRWHLNRARELGADSYCVHHACDSKDCPPGEH
jgi:hypothetical protein